MKGIKVFSQCIAVMVLAIFSFMVFVHAQGPNDEKTVAVANHDWKSQTQLGLKFVFSPKMAATAEVFRVYKYGDVGDLVWNTDVDRTPAFDLVVSDADEASGVIVRNVDIRQLFHTRENFENFKDQQPDVLVRFALPHKLKDLDVEPDHMVIHWAGSTTESIGVGEEAENIARQLATSAHLD